MAAQPETSSVEEELKKLLKEEYWHRIQFYEQCRTMINRRREEMERQQGTNCPHMSVADLAKRLNNIEIDSPVSFLLGQEEAQQRQKDGDRDSGIPASPNVSTDADSQRRHGVYLPETEIPGPASGLDTPTGLSELIQQVSLSDSMAAMGPSTREPQENSDNSSMEVGENHSHGAPASPVICSEDMSVKL